MCKSIAITKTLLLSVLLGLAAHSTALAQPVATIEVTSVPSQALIFLDRELKGKGHVELYVAPGRHLLRVAAADDYETYIREVDLSPDQPTRLRIQLAPSARRWLQQGRTLLGQNDFDQAAKSFARCEVKLPVEAAWWQGIALWKLGKNAEALAQFRRYAQFITDSPELYLFLGLLHNQLNHQGEAFTAYKTALLLPSALGPDVLDGLPEATYDSIKEIGKPDKVEDKVRLAQLLMLKGQQAQALTWITAAVQDHFGNWTLRNWSQWEPKVPPAKVELVAPPEDTSH